MRFDNRHHAQSSTANETREHPTPTVNAAALHSTPLPRASWAYKDPPGPGQLHQSTFALTIEVKIDCGNNTTASDVRLRMQPCSTTLAHLPNPLSMSNLSISNIKHSHPEWSSRPRCCTTGVVAPGSAAKLCTTRKCRFRRCGETSQRPEVPLQGPPAMLTVLSQRTDQRLTTTRGCYSILASLSKINFQLLNHSQDREIAVTSALPCSLPDLTTKCSDANLPPA